MYLFLVVFQFLKFDCLQSFLSIQKFKEKKYYQKYHTSIYYNIILPYNLLKYEYISIRLSFFFSYLFIGIPEKKSLTKACFQSITKFISLSFFTLIPSFLTHRPRNQCATITYYPVYTTFRYNIFRMKCVY